MLLGTLITSAITVPIIASCSNKSNHQQIKVSPDYINKSTYATTLWYIQQSYFNRYEKIKMIPKHDKSLATLISIYAPAQFFTLTVAMKNDSAPIEIKYVNGSYTSIGLNDANDYMKGIIIKDVIINEYYNDAILIESQVKIGDVQILPDNDCHFSKNEIQNMLDYCVLNKETLTKFLNKFMYDEN